MKDFMFEAVKEAKKALKKDEVPIGAVIVYNGEIIARGFNKRQSTQNAIHHAEIVAIEKACKCLKSWRLDDCDIYVTLEPCPMCAGAIANARIKNLFYACEEQTSKDNLCKSILESDRLNHKVNIVFDDKYQKICSELLSEFFKNKRK